MGGNRFITAWLGVLDAESHRLTSFSAGQAPILCYRAARDEVEVLEADSPPLGLLPKIPVLVPPPIDLQPGDIFVVLSDGFYEAESSDGEEFEKERVMEIVRRYHGNGSGEILAELRSSLSVFTNGAPFADDRTALLIKRVV